MPFECIPFSEHNPDLSRMLRPDFPGTAASRTQVRRRRTMVPLKRSCPLTSLPGRMATPRSSENRLSWLFPRSYRLVSPPLPPPVPRARETRRIRVLFGYERMRWRLRSLSPSFLSFFLLFPCFLSFLLFFFLSFSRKVYSEAGPSAII